MSAKIKYSNYESIIIHEKGNRTGFASESGADQLAKFKSLKTAVKMIVFKSTHNNTRLKKFAEYGMEFK